MTSSSVSAVDAIVSLFRRIAAVPRCSGREEAISQWLLDWASEHGFAAARDEADNVCVRVPGSLGRESETTVVLQSHVDMVCVKAEGSAHDFSRDPIEVRRDGDWLVANGTTLGADNGIGMALALFAAIGEDVSHPPLELLFTTSEERGPAGVLSLTPAFLTGRTLVNLDSESEGVLYVGCAGSSDVTAALPARSEPVGTRHAASRVTVDGLLGGHSGIEIHKHRANAIKLLAATLKWANSAVSLRLVSIDGGTAMNAIPPAAEAVVVCEEGAQTALAEAVAHCQDRYRGIHAGIEPGLSIRCAVLDGTPSCAIAAEDTQRALDFLTAYPTGVYEMSADIPGQPETSNNLAHIASSPEAIACSSMQRSSSQTKLEELTRAIESLAALAGASCAAEYKSPPWTPNMDSPLLARCREVYTRECGAAPSVETVHAGLECAMLVDRFPGMDAISFGPLIENAHTPNERACVSSADRTWRFLKALLREI